MANNKDKQDNGEKNVNFENCMTRLQEIVALLQEGDLPLKESLNIYKEGLECTRQCRQFLDQAKKDIEIWKQEEYDSENYDDTDIVQDK